MAANNTTTTIKQPNANTISPPQIQNSPPTMQQYQQTGFYGSANIPALQEHLASMNRTPEQIRSDAEALYKPEFNMQKTAFENQLSELAWSRDREIKALNSQYDRTLNSVMAGLNKNGMGRSSLVATRGVETENARNSAIADVSYNYLQKQNEINADLQKAESEYAQNVENKAVELTNENRNQQLNLLSQIAQLQQGGYSSYVQYLQNLQSLEMQGQSNDIQRQMAEYQNQSIGIQNEGIDLQRQSIGLQNEGIGLQRENIAIQNEGQALQNQRYALDIEQTKLNNQLAEIARDSAGIENDRRQASLDYTAIQNQIAALQQQSAELDKQRIEEQKKQAKIKNDIQKAQNEYLKKLNKLLGK